ncbi:MAG TPA: efflux RND transporter periplasmic adaptor subunit [Gemmataceae bacterium]|nr:efflux RND transporter periplasmic adaptor subunit [Gemmataceae bacterium]
MGHRDLALLLRRFGHNAVECGVSDSILLQRFLANRDEAAFELLLWRHARLVFGVCQRVLHDRHDAEDAFQATILILARKAASISKGDALASWLYKVAFRTALTLRSKRARKACGERAFAAEQMSTVSDDPVSPGESDELRGILDEELNRLPGRLRAPIVLCYLEGKTIDEAALQTGWPRGTVASRLARARARLRVRLTRRGLASAAGLLTIEQAAGALGLRSLTHTAWLDVMRATASGNLSHNVISLTREVLRAMFWHKIKTGGLIVCAVVGVLLAGGGLAVHLRAGAGEEPKAAADENARSHPNPQTKAAEKAVDGAPSVREVMVTHPVRRNFTPYSEFVGRLQAAHTVGIRARVSGCLEKILFNPGSDVKKGDLLFEIDPRVYQVAVDKAEAGLAVAEAQLKLGQENLGRIQALFQRSSAPIEDLQKAQAEAAVGKAKVKLAIADVQRARLDLAATKVTAPISGQIGRPSLDVGSEVIGSGDRPTLLATISSFDPVLLAFDMDERSYLRYRQLFRNKEVKGTGSSLAMVINQEKMQPITGTLQSFDVRVDADSGTVRVYGVFPNPERILLPGMFARVKVPFGRERAVLIIPQSAVFTDNTNRRWVYVVNQDNRLARRGVEILQNEDDNAAIEPGSLQPDDVILFSDSKGHDGEKVKPLHKSDDESRPKK